MKILWIIVFVGVLAAMGDAKRKRKFDGDFEFAEEVGYTEAIPFLLCVCVGAIGGGGRFFLTLLFNAVSNSNEF